MITISTKTLQLAGYVLPPDDVVLTEPQTLTEAQKQQARDNIGVTKDAVLTTPQTLTEAQKQQARDNIGVTKDAVLTTPQTLTDSQKKQARDNIGVAEATAPDAALSDTSTNSVQNKVVKVALDGKSDTTHNHTASDVGTYSTTEIDTKLLGKSDTTHDHNTAYLRYDEAQSLTSAQKKQVRRNAPMNRVFKFVGSDTLQYEYTDKSGLAVLYLVCIHDGNPEASERRHTTIMVDWAMTEDETTYPKSGTETSVKGVFTYNFPKVSGIDSTAAVGFMRVTKASGDGITFTIAGDTGEWTHGISYIYGYI